MGYEKTTWETGDVITAEKLNNLEVGVVNSGTPVLQLEPVENVGMVVNITYAELETALQSGGMPLIRTIEGDGESVSQTIYDTISTVTMSHSENDGYQVVVVANGSEIVFFASSDDERLIMADFGGGTSPDDPVNDV